MNLVLTVLEIVAPVFLLAGIGFAWVKLGFEYRIQFVTQLAMTLSVPCLIFVSLMTTQIDPAALSALSLATVAAYGGVTLLAAVVVRVFGLNRRTYLAPMIFGNTGNLGLPLALFAFGDTGLGYAVVVFAIMAIWSFTFGIWLVAGSGSFGIGRAVVLSLIKLAICIGIAALAGWFFDLDKIAFGVLVLQVATPVAVTSYLLAEKYGADAQSVAGLVVVSTVLSVAALPLMLGFLL